MKLNSGQTHTPSETLPEDQVDALIESLKSTPLCPRCGVPIKGAPYIETVRCPLCNSHVRHAGGIWMVYVSPLSL